MTFPSDVGVIDLMMGIPEGHKKDWYGFLRAGLMDEESKEMEFPVEYMFKGVPDDLDEGADPVAVVLGEMDHFGIEKAMLGTSFERGTSLRAIQDHPDRFFGSYEVNPNKGMQGVRDLVKAYETVGIKAATAFPAGMTPQVPINDKRFYPIYAKCIELDIAICITTGVPGPRVPALASNRVLYRDGTAAGVLISAEPRILEQVPSPQQWELTNLLMRSHAPASLARLLH